MEIVVFAAAAGFLAGLYRLGFSAGMAWLLITGFLAFAFWPLAAALALAIMCYGLAGAVRLPRRRLGDATIRPDRPDDWHGVRGPVVSQSLDYRAERHA